MSAPPDDSEYSFTAQDEGPGAKSSPLPGGPPAFVKKVTPLDSSKLSMAGMPPLPYGGGSSSSSSSSSSGSGSKFSMEGMPPLPSEYGGKAPTGPVSRAPSAASGSGAASSPTGAGGGGGGGGVAGAPRGLAPGGPSGPAPSGASPGGPSGPPTLRAVSPAPSSASAGPGPAQALGPAPAPAPASPAPAAAAAAAPAAGPARGLAPGGPGAVPPPSSSTAASVAADPADLRGRAPGGPGAVAPSSTPAGPARGLAPGGPGAVPPSSSSTAASVAADPADLRGRAPGGPAAVAVPAARESAEVQAARAEAAQWTSGIDPRYNVPFFVYKPTGVSQWDKPACLAVVEAADAAAAAAATGSGGATDAALVAPPAPRTVPPGWDAVQDAGSGRNYYRNVITGAVQWEIPTVRGDLDPNALPFGWEEKIDTSRNLPFYVHPASGTTVWERPLNVPQMAAAKSKVDTDLAALAAVVEAGDDLEARRLGAIITMDLNRINVTEPSHCAAVYSQMTALQARLVQVQAAKATALAKLELTNSNNLLSSALATYDETTVATAHKNFTDLVSLHGPAIGATHEGQIFMAEMVAARDRGGIALATLTKFARLRRSVDDNIAAVTASTRMGNADAAIAAYDRAAAGVVEARTMGLALPVAAVYAEEANARVVALNGDIAMARTQVQLNGLKTVLEGRKSELTAAAAAADAVTALNVVALIDASLDSLQRMAQRDLDPVAAALWANYVVDTRAFVDRAKLNLQQALSAAQVQRTITRLTECKETVEGFAKSKEWDFVAQLLTELQTDLDASTADLSSTTQGSQFVSSTQTWIDAMQTRLNAARRTAPSSNPYGPTSGGASSNPYGPSASSNPYGPSSGGASSNPYGPPSVAAVGAGGAVGAAIPPSSAATLPAGWEEKWDANHRRYLYIDHNTRTTTWTKPASTTAASTANLPSGWGTSLASPTSSPSSSASSWGTTSSSAAMNGSTTHVAGENAGLPSGWEAKWDAGSSRFYYVDHNTRTTHWTRPSAGSSSSSGRNTVGPSSSPSSSGSLSSSTNASAYSTLPRNSTAPRGLQPGGPGAR